ncbi:MAG: plastocyanin/azurin family copper-binding protein [Xanthomarina sp.]
MKTLKTNSKGAFLVLTILLLLITSNAFAQKAKVIDMKGTDELRFSVENIQATPGQIITVKLSNESKFAAAAMSHNFVLLKPSANAEAFDKASLKHPANGYIAPELEGQIIAHTGMAAGGETVEVTFNAPKKPGKYLYICTFPGHFGAGMKGTLTVK